MKNILQIISISFLLFTAAESVAQANEDWAEVNLAVVDNQLLPKYSVFKDATLALENTATAFCSDVNASSLNEFQQAFHHSMDAWQAIQHIQFGPITYFNSNFRLQYWPDEKGTGNRQLTTLIASNDNSALEENSFARKSVGIQGFPALENLLFAEASLIELAGSDYRCQVALTISKNISQIASETYANWTDQYRATVANADDSDEFESAEDATIDFLKALVETIPKIQEQKLVPIIGSNFESSRLRRAESWRSKRSLQNIKINLQSLNALFNEGGEGSVVLSSVLQADDVELINAAFADIESTLNNVSDSMELALADEVQYSSLQELVVQLEQLDDVLENALKNTDLYLGFNSLDGD